MPKELDHHHDEQRRLEDLLRAYTRNYENAPDPTHERFEWTDSPEKEPRTYRVTGAPQRIEPPSYLERDHNDDGEEVRLALTVEAERLQRERDGIYQSIDPQVHFDPNAEAAHRKRERGEIDWSSD